MKIQKNYRELAHKLIPVFGVGFLSFFAFAFTANTINPISSASAEGSSKVAASSPADYAVTINSSGNLNLVLDTVPYTNVVRAADDTVTTTVNRPSSAPASETKLYLSTDSTTNNNLSNGTHLITSRGSLAFFQVTVPLIEI